MEAPYYLPISAEGTPLIHHKGVSIGVVAGDLEGVRGPAKTYSPQTLLRIEAESNSKIEIPIPKNYNTILYLLNGSLLIEGEKITAKTMVWFKNDGDKLSFEAEESSTFIILSGEPIRETVVCYGPFVMNKEEELQQAVFDFQSGQMGELVENFDE